MTEQIIILCPSSIFPSILKSSFHSFIHPFNNIIHPSIHLTCPHSPCPSNSCPFYRSIMPFFARGMFHMKFLHNIAVKNFCDEAYCFITIASVANILLIIKLPFLQLRLYVVYLIFVQKENNLITLVRKKLVVNTDFL